MQEIKSNLPGGMKGFLAWLQKTQPRIHERLSEQLRSTELSGLGVTAPDQTSTAPAATSTVDKIKDMILALSQGYLTFEQMNAQKKVLDLQLSRAQQGLPPLNLDMQQYGLTGPSINVGMSADTKKVLMYGGIGLAAVLLLPKFLRGRK